ncbi:MAG: response regulator [Elusimicrobiota bacterium]
MYTKIAIVDNDKKYRRDLRKSLGEYNSIGVSNGKEAVRLLKEPNEIGLVILNVIMPEMKGIEFLTKIKKCAPGISVIISTAYATKDSIINALRNRADDYIEKTLDTEQIKAIIENVLERKKENFFHSVDAHSKMDRVKDIIKRNWYKKLSLVDVAELVYLSPKYLSRAFKRETGMNFNKYKFIVKMNKAKNLLQEHNCSISYISEKMGYLNTESFIRMFKKFSGYTPAEYRKMILLKRNDLRVYKRKKLRRIILP